MGHYIRRRLITAIPVFFGITLLVFLLFDLAPGSIVDLMGEGAAQAGDREALEQALGLDRPLPARYLSWLAGLFRGALGESFFYRRPVAALIAQRVGPSLLLTGTGVLLAVAIALIVHKMPRLERIVWMLVLGGGLGNLIDRVRTGVVVDYLNFQFIDFPVFNFADICVCTGVGLLVLSLLLDLRKERRAAASAPAQSEQNDADA